MSVPGIVKERTNGAAQQLLSSPARRNRSRVAVGVFLVVTLSLAFAVSYSNAGERQAVLAVARPVAPGAVIAGADLRDVRVSADPGLRSIPATDRSKVVGRVAGVALVPGTLVTPAQLASGPRVEPGRAVVGLALKPGQFPPELRAGDPVVVVLTSAGGAAPTVEGDTTPTAAVSVKGRIAGVVPSPGGGPETVVSLDVADAIAPAIAIAAGRGQASLILTGTGS